MLTLLLLLVPLGPPPAAPAPVTAPIGERQVADWLQFADGRACSVAVTWRPTGLVYTVRLTQDRPRLSVTVQAASLPAGLAEAVRRWSLQDWDDPEPDTAAPCQAWLAFAEEPDPPDWTPVEMPPTDPPPPPPAPRPTPPRPPRG